MLRLRLKGKEQEALLAFIKKQIVALDLKLVTESILFVLEMSSEECVVTLEGPYPAMRGNTAEIKALLGDVAFK